MAQKEKSSKRLNMFKNRKTGLIEREYIMYHATSAAIANIILKTGFKVSTGGTLGPGVYVSRCIDKARGYGPSIIKCRVRCGKVKRIAAANDPMRLQWQAHGYDCAYIPAMGWNGYTENCIKNPNRVKPIGLVR